jgi:hypothetical protein
VGLVEVEAHFSILATSIMRGISNEKPADERELWMA